MGKEPILEENKFLLKENEFLKMKLKRLEEQ